MNSIFDISKIFEKSAKFPLLHILWLVLNPKYLKIVGKKIRDSQTMTQKPKIPNKICSGSWKICFSYMSNLTIFCFNCIKIFICNLFHFVYLDLFGKVNFIKKFILVGMSVQSSSSQKAYRT